MQPQRLVGFIVLALGILLMVLGLREMDSFGSQFTEFFTGSPTDRAVWLIIGGVIGIVAGAGLALVPFRGSRA